MTILFRLENPGQFTVFVDGAERARIRRGADHWRMYRTDGERFLQVDVTKIIADQVALTDALSQLLSA